MVRLIEYAWWRFLSKIENWRLQSALDELDDLERHGCPCDWLQEKSKRDVKRLTASWLRYEHNAAQCRKD